MDVNKFILIRVLLDCVGLLMVAFILYVFVYYVRKFMLMKWIAKAVNAAEMIFKVPGHTKENSEVKKDWVIKFLKDNGLTTGVSDEVVDTLIESEVNLIQLQQSEAENVK